MAESSDTYALFGDATGRKKEPRGTDGAVLPLIVFRFLFLEF
jgi:hypothetical protein